MKEKILTLLVNADDYISGEAMSEQLGITRSAVWKYINKLRTEGYEITSVTNRGYKLNASPDIISADALAPYLKTHCIARSIVCLDETDSTNDEAKRSHDMPDGTLFTADRQTSGKGRLGRGWSSEKMSGIYMSLLLKPNISPEEIPKLTLIAGLAVCNALNAFLTGGVRAGIKWPNDIIIGTKKVCGILTEMSAETDRVEYAVCGMGINVNTRFFDEELSAKATSMFRETGVSYIRAKIIAAVMNEFEPLYESFLADGPDAILPEYKKNCITIGKRVILSYKKNTYDTIAEDIDSDGYIVAEINGEKHHISSGEVSVRGLLGYV